MIEVWGRADSSNVQAVMWCIGELGLPHRRHDLGHRFGGLDTDDFRALNPNGTIPVIRDCDGAPIWESGAILRYLAAAYGTSSFWPADPVARAQADKWAEWAKINAAAGFTGPVFWRVVRTPAPKREPEKIAQAVARFEGWLRIAATQLARNDWLAGDSFTLADIQLGHVLWRYYDIPIERAPLPEIRAYHDRLMARAPYREHVAVSYEALRA